MILYFHAYTKEAEEAADPSYQKEAVLKAFSYARKLQGQEE